MASGFGHLQMDEERRRSSRRNGDRDGVVRRAVFSNGNHPSVRRNSSWNVSPTGEDGAISRHLSGVAFRVFAAFVRDDLVSKAIPHAGGSDGSRVIPSGLPPGTYSSRLS